MVNKDLVSVVIPMYNSRDYIQETLSSVLKQTFKNLEVIIVDDGSTDDSVEIVKKTIHATGEDRVKIFNLTSNSSTPAIPRNHGIRAAHGRYIAFLDSDDVWHPEKINIQLDLMKASNSYMCSTFSTDFRNNLIFYPVKKKTRKFFFYISLFDQMIKYRTPTSSILIDSKIIKKNLHNESLFFKGKEDLHNSLILHSRYGKSIKSSNLLVFYRKHKNQTSSSKFIMMMKTIYILLTTDLKRYNGYRLLFPLFLITNFIFYIYFRIILKKL
jgi:teichuronic acid biosynthesis glycosyltransferase TuaG